MEKELYDTYFEQLLKDATEDFKMYPSQRVWNSLYNNLHPAKRWPSLAVCLLLVTGILYIGITNNNAINSNLKPTAISQVVVIDNYKNNVTETNPLLKDVIETGTSTVKNTLPQVYDKFLRDQERVKQLLSFNNDFTNATATPEIQKLDQSNVIVESNKQQIAENLESKIPYSISSPQAMIDNIGNKDKSTENYSPSSNQQANIQDIVKVETINTENINNKVSEILYTNSVNNDKAWIDNYAFYNRSNRDKWKPKSALSYYINPSIGFRKIEDNSSYKPGLTNAFVTSSTGNINSDIDQEAAINLEAGAVMLYSVTKKLRLKGGVQLNYTNYTINAYELKHPAQTTLMLNNSSLGNYPLLEPYNTLYANSPALSSSKLNNNTIQISVPLGFDYKIAGNNKVQWFAGATLQPTYVAAGHAYLISSDKKFYVNDNSFIKHWNLNTAIETFVSYKTNSGIIITAGPQLRYQLFSSYIKQYTYTEKLYNLGLKMGITRNF